MNTHSSEECYVRNKNRAGKKPSVLKNSFFNNPNANNKSHITSSNYKSKPLSPIFEAYINGNIVEILLDTGPDENFISSRVRSRLNLTEKTVEPIEVKFGNNATFVCDKTISAEFKLVKFPEHNFNCNFRIIDSENTSLILGTQ